MTSRPPIAPPDPTQAPCPPETPCRDPEAVPSATPEYAPPAPNRCAPDNVPVEAPNPDDATPQLPDRED